MSNKNEAQESLAKEDNKLSENMLNKSVPTETSSEDSNVLPITNDDEIDEDANSAKTYSSDDEVKELCGISDTTACTDNKSSNTDSEEQVNTPSEKLEDEVSSNVSADNTDTKLEANNEKKSEKDKRRDQLKGITRAERKDFKAQEKKDKKRQKEIAKKLVKREKTNKKLRKRKERNLAKQSTSKQKTRKRRQSAETNMARRNMWLLILVVVLVCGSIFVAYPPQDKINQGLDIQGGLSVVLAAESTEDGGTVSADGMKTSKDIIESRVNALGASEATVTLQGDNQILVQIPGMTDTVEALETIGRTGSLVFARLDSFTDEDVVSSIEAGTYIQKETRSDGYGNYFETGNVTYLEVSSDIYEVLISGDHIESVTIGQESITSGYYTVNITFDSEGTAAFAAATADLAGENGKIVIILDGEVQSAPAVQTEITNGEVSITGDYTLEEAQNLKTILDSGSLPVSFTFEQAQIVGPTLGQSELTAGFVAMAVGVVLVLIYLLIFYRGFGIIIAANMLVLGILYIGLLALLSSAGVFSLSLSGLAGIILTIGMAADSSILVIERFRDALKMGRSVKACSQTAVKHGILTSLDADVVALISALALFFFASSSVRGFGLALALGIICDIIVMFIFKAPIIRLLAPVCMDRFKGFWGIRKPFEFGEEYGQKYIRNRKLAAESASNTGAQRQTALSSGANASNDKK